MKVNCIKCSFSCGKPTIRFIAEELVQDLYERGGIDIREAFIDEIFVPAKKGRLAVGKTKRGKGTKVMAIADAAGFPVAGHVES